VFAWGWRAAPGWLAYTAALLVAGAVTSVLYPVCLALVINAALHHDSQRLILGVAGLAVLFTLTWTFGMLAGTSASTLSDKTTFYLTARIAEQLHSVTGVDHLERPAYRTELDLWQQNLRLLASPPPSAVPSPTGRSFPAVSGSASPSRAA
jgi:hypothetical protein